MARRAIHLAEPATMERNRCALCGGGIAVEAIPGRPASVPERRVCRRCGAEYGTTKPGERR